MVTARSSPTGRPSAGGRLLRAGDEDRRDDADLAVGGARGVGPDDRFGVMRLRSQSKGSGGSASRIVIGRSLVSGLSLSPRPNSATLPLSSMTGGSAVSSPRSYRVRAELVLQAFEPKDVDLGEDRGHDRLPPGSPRVGPERRQ